MFLRQSTAQTILFGPCLDITDGVTEEVALTLAQADMRLSKDGGAFAQKNAAGNATHDSDGWYSTSLDATDTATVGILRLNVHQPANMLPLWDTFFVLTQEVYDDIFGASGIGYLKATTPGNDLDVAATGEAGIDLGNTLGNLVAADFGAGSLDDKGNWNVGKSGYALTTQNWNVGKTGYSLTQGFPTNFASMAVTAGGVVDADITAINGSATAAVQLALSANEIEDGQCEGTPTTTVIQTDLAETQDDIYIGRTIIFTSGNARGEASDITDYVGSTGTLTVTLLANAPAATDTFIIL